MNSVEIRNGPVNSSGTCVRLGLLVALCLVAYRPARAQYYEEREYEPMSSRYLYAGVMRIDFTARSSNPAPESLRTGFDGYMPVIGFRQGLSDVTFGYTRFTLFGASRTSVFLGLNIANELRLSGGRENALVLPVLIAADFTKAEARGTTRDDFNVASLGLGAGLKYRYHSPGLDVSLQATQAIQYSFEGYSYASGSSAVTAAEVTFALKDVGPTDGIVIGYRFRFQTWSMSDDRFDYRSIAHGPFLGIAF